MNSEQEKQEAKKSWLRLVEALKTKEYSPEELKVIAQDEKKAAARARRRIANKEKK